MFDKKHVQNALTLTQWLLISTNGQCASLNNALHLCVISIVLYY